jgi:GH24 family phage-related lysozyme (muramidase)
METSPKGKQLIKNSEGFDPIPRDDCGHLCWGHGHDRVGNEPVPASITLADADALLDEDLQHVYEPALNRHIPPICTQNQYDALADFTYEFGEGGLKELLAHGWDQVPVQLPRWIHVKDKNGVLVESEGLKKRRAAEVALFTS